MEEKVGKGHTIQLRIIVQRCSDANKDGIVHRAHPVLIHRFLPCVAQKYDRLISPMRHDHTLLPAQDELLPARPSDLSIEGLREGERNARPVSVMFEIVASKCSGKKWRGSGDGGHGDEGGEEILN